MHPIITSTGKSLNSNSFMDYILKVCDNHKNKGRAIAFAFIVYDFNDDTITKILNDENYWTSLDNISGHYLTVFYIHSKYINFINLKSLKFNPKESDFGVFHSLTRVDTGSTPLSEINETIKKYFQIDDNINEPFVLFFQTDGHEIIDYFLVSLKQEKAENAFLELKEHIRNAVEGIKYVTADNFKNDQEIFDLLKMEVKSGQFYTVINKKILPKIPLISLLMSFVNR
jgi:hypothetical protein